MIVDLSILMSFKELDPDEPEAFLRQLVGVYIQQADKDVTQIVSAHRSGSLAELQEFSHRLKSASLQLGLLKVAECAKEIERLAIGKTTMISFNQWVAELDSSYQKSRKILEEFLENNAKIKP